MRKFILLISVLINNGLMYSQSSILGQGDASLSVTVTNPQFKTIIVEINPITLEARPAVPDQRKLQLNTNNTGVMNIQLKGPVVLKIMNVWDDSTVSYIALPGTSLNVHLDGLRNDVSTLDGKGIKENVFYQSVLNKCFEVLKHIPQLNSEQYLKIWSQEREAIRQQITAAHVDGLDRNYMSWIWKSVQSLFQTELSGQLMNYVTLLRQWPSNMSTYRREVLHLTTTQLNDAKGFTSEMDPALVESYYLFQTLMQLNERGQPAPMAETVYKEAIIKAGKIKTESVKKLMLSHLISTGIAQTTDVSFLLWLKPHTLKHNNKYYLKLITDREQLLKIAGKGKSAPLFEAVSQSGESFSLSNYRGKFLYIDIWATWCAPCREELPYLEKLKKVYREKSIEFVSVSIDRHLKIWENFVKTNSSDNQFYSSPGKKNGISSVYQAAYIPAFILIDPEGKIVDPRCPRPSDPKLEFVLNRLLQTTKPI